MPGDARESAHGAAGDLRDQIAEKIRKRLGSQLELFPHAAEFLADGVMELIGAHVDALEQRQRAEQAEAAIEGVTTVLRLFASADAHSELFWRVYGRSIRLYANVSDVFAWGTADLEEITAGRLPELQRAYDDLVAIDAAEWLAMLFAARVRQMRPQGAAYPDNPDVRALLDECEPEREIGLMNPRLPTALSPAGGSEKDEGLPSPPEPRRPHLGRPSGRPR